MTNQPPPLDAERVSDERLADDIAELEHRIAKAIESFGSAPAAMRERLSIRRELQRLRATQRESGGESDAERYLANALHEKDSQAARRVGPRWWCLREDLRKLYIEKARAVIDFWAAREAETVAKYSRVDDEIAALCTNKLNECETCGGDGTITQDCDHCNGTGQRKETP